MSDEPRPTLVHFKKSDPMPMDDARGAWTILIVDDEPEVHVVTKLVLKDKTIFGRRLEFIDGMDSKQAMDILRREEGIAVILLDVVMETDDAGLLLARWIREDLHNSDVRIILRTGQPGRAPEARIMVDYEINDYKEKTDLTTDKLFSSVVNAIRGYRDIKKIQGSKHGMEMILNASPNLFQMQSLKLFASGVLTQLISLLNATQDAVFLDISGFAAQARPSGYTILAGAGKYRDLVDSRLENSISPAMLALLDGAMSGNNSAFKDGTFVTSIENPAGEKSVIFLEGCPNLEDIDQRLVALYCTNVSAAFSNICLFEEIKQQLAEKRMLLSEIHHRVRNNLQVLISLIHLSELDNDQSSQQILDSTKERMATMSSVLDHIYSEKDERVDFAAVVDDIVSDILTADAHQGKRGAVSVTVDDFQLPIEKAMPCALIINELLMLGLGHNPSPGEGFAISLQLVNEHQGGHSIILKLPASFSLSLSSLTTKLLSSLAEQLDGDFKRQSDAGTLEISVTFR